MYNCPLHNWSSFEKHCSSCFPQVVTTSTNTLIVNQEPESKESDAVLILSTICKQWDYYAGDVSEGIIQEAKDFLNNISKQ